MGGLSSKDTRRITFDNTFALNPSKTVQMSIENVEDIMDFHDIPIEPSDELFLQDVKKSDMVQEDEDNDYWLQRIESLREEHLIINKIIEFEYDKKMESINNIFQTKVSNETIQQIKPCFDWRAKIVKCYADNPRQPLVCSAAVEAFSKCIASCAAENK